MPDDENRTSPTAKTITPVDEHREQTVTTGGLADGWVSPSKIEPEERLTMMPLPLVPAVPGAWKAGIPGYLGAAPWPAEEVAKLRAQLSEETHRRFAAEQLVDALEDLVRLLDPHIQRRLQHKARVAVVEARAAWETTLRKPVEVAGQGEREL